MTHASKKRGVMSFSSLAAASVTTPSFLVEFSNAEAIILRTEGVVQTTAVTGPSRERPYPGG